MILLDTSAVIWIARRHPRTRALLRAHRRLYLSPAVLLELQFLQEAGRIRVDRSMQSVIDDDRWTLDEPPSAAWFLEAIGVSWTRDPFDRLLVAHAQLRGWRLATGDAVLIDQLGPTRCVPL
ncbi:MAG TPA: PIN domain-containing protein [Vicinamibacterales bacterium]|nr:PIN domain-containing protein [Vicinamibacterales bacterium]